jgi:hypothetical protein
VRGVYRVVELTSQEALELEGQEQEHCVGSYAAQCLDGQSAIFSVRRAATGEILSTFEVSLDGKRPALARHHGYANAAPEAELAALASRFLERVIAPLPAAHIAAVREARRTIGAGVSRFLPQPNTALEALSCAERAQLAELVAPAHPRAARRRGIAAYLQEAPRPGAPSDTATQPD